MKIPWVLSQKKIKMKKNPFKSNSAFVVIGESPAWKETKEIGSLFSLVQDCNFKINLNRQSHNQIGSNVYSYNEIVNSPKVDLSLSYYLSSFLNNELLMGFMGRGVTEKQALSQIGGKDYNFYLVIDSKKNEDANIKAKSTSTNYSGSNVVSFGNCQLKNYNLSFNVNSIPTVSVNFDSSNVNFDLLTGNFVKIPAVNNLSGNFVNNGFYDFDPSGLSGKFLVSDVDAYKLPTVSNSNLNFNLMGLSAGGVSLLNSSTPAIQSFDLSFEIPRVDLYGLGSNYIYDRKIKYPIVASIKMQYLVDEFISSSIKNISDYNKEYDFSVTFYDIAKKATGIFDFRKVKLVDFSHSMSVNQRMIVSSSFIVEIGKDNDYEKTQGLSFSRAVQGDYESIWEEENRTWSSINVSWNVV